MLYGIWEIANLQGSVPNTREGATACLIDQKLYLFGGFGRDIFNDMYYVTLDDYRWKFIKEHNRHEYKPSPRFCHSMIVHENKLYMFGGAGKYEKDIKSRVSYNDLNVFDTMTEKWHRIEDSRRTPCKRVYH